MTSLILQSALGGMTSGPRSLLAALRYAADDDNYDADGMRTSLVAAGPGDEALGLLRKRLASWDNESPKASWAEATPPNTTERRRLIYAKLKLDENWVVLCETRLPFKPLSRPVVIATEHTVWYSPERASSRRFYWEAYAAQLGKQGWLDDSVEELNASTTAIVERLADPTAGEAYQAKGLVVGYVQSGKTANFTGVIAKAGDAGYRLVIVLGGMLDVLRSQTQRRIDKELVGQELLGREYVDDPDWPEFVSHGSKPSDLGEFDWYRLTGPEEDYQALRYGVDALKFEANDPNQAFNHPDNVYRAPARIAVLKKNSKVLARLLKDLAALERKGLGAPLGEIPALIIDDESDQGGVNTRPPATRDEEQERTATNKGIVALLRLLPRAQYVGYTATPFANVFVDPSDDSDIFPKDFLIALGRPHGYMGVSDFYDLDAGEDDERPNKRDFVREVTDDDVLPRNLPRALDCFILSAALKLWRAEHDTSLRFRHHTMLVHVSERQAEQKELAKEVRRLYGKSGYDGGVGLDRLKELFENDFKQVHGRRGNDLAFPTQFEHLLPAIGDALERIGEPEDAVIIVNTEHKDQTPDFDKRPIWKILVGGTKLSRGYTVEGLTVSYYRRRAGAGDTLMQMGRWFGFRRGYNDLVRLFIGTAERVGRSGRRVDLYEAFGGVCRDEERFRAELERYASMEDPRITPSKIPPLVPQHLLRPTAPNKMRNAVLEFRNFGGALAESTYAPTRVDQIEANNALVEKILAGKQLINRTLQGLVNGKTESRDGWTTLLSNSELIQLLKSYKWYDPGTREARQPNPLQLQIEFLQGKAGDHQIQDWLFLAPRYQNATAKSQFAGKEFDVIYRSRHQNGARFHTYNEPRHRAFARHISMLELLINPNPILEELKSPHRGVLLFYRITDTPKGSKIKPPYTSGFTLIFPQNNLTTPLGFTVRRPDEPEEAVVDIE